MSFWFEKKQGWMIQQKSTIRIAQLLLFFSQSCFWKNAKSTVTATPSHTTGEAAKAAFTNPPVLNRWKSLLIFWILHSSFFSSQILNKKINLASWRSCKALGIQTSNVRRHLDPKKSTPKTFILSRYDWKTRESFKTTPNFVHPWKLPCPLNTDCFDRKYIF